MTKTEEYLSQSKYAEHRNAETIKRVHSRVDQIQASYKTLKGVGTFVVTALTAVGAWFGLIQNK